MPIVNKLINSSRYSIEGLVAVWKKEQAFRLEIYVCIVAVPLIFFLSLPKLEKLILLLLLLLLLTIELINSAIEVLVDRVSYELHPLSKIAKDAGSAAVGVVILMNFIAWVVIVFL